MEGSPPLRTRDRSERSALLRRRQHPAGRRWQRVPTVAAAVAAAAERSGAATAAVSQRMAAELLRGAPEAVAQLVDATCAPLRRELAQTQEQCRTLARRLAEQQEKSGGVFGRWL